LSCEIFTSATSKFASCKKELEPIAGCAVVKDLRFASY
jgi:hypothetical protein